MLHFYIITIYLLCLSVRLSVCRKFKSTVESLVKPECLEMGERIFVPIRLSLCNLKKTYIGDNRSIDPHLNFGTLL